MTPRSLLLTTAGPILHWVLLAASVWVLYRGHHLPGGGFIGGLVAVSATIVSAVSQGRRLAERRMLFGDATTLAGAGVALSLASGLVGFWLGRPFLTHPWVRLPLGITTLDVSSVLVFDAGVYLAVWGSVGGYALRLLELHTSDDEGGDR